jgi:hypothetical protein
MTIRQSRIVQILDLHRRVVRDESSTLPSFSELFCLADLFLIELLSAGRSSGPTNHTLTAEYSDYPMW